LNVLLELLIENIIFYTNKLQFAESGEGKQNNMASFAVWQFLNVKSTDQTHWRR